MSPRLSVPVSGIDCPSVDPSRNCLLLLASLLSSHQLLSWSPATNCLSALLPPTALLLGRVVNSHSRPLTTSGYGEIFLSKNPLSGFAPKQTIESSALTAQPHSATNLQPKEQLGNKNIYFIIIRKDCIMVSVRGSVV